MNRLAILTLILATTTAQAGITAKIPTNAGGYIRLTDNDCQDQASKVAYTVVSATGEIISGCWGYDADEGLVWVKYANGSAFFYTITDDMVTDYGRSKIDAPEKINM